MIALDFTNADTFRKLADLPYYGWAEAVVRRAYPLWKVSPDEPAIFKVKLERGSEGCWRCDGECCGDVGDFEQKTLRVEAFSDESARELAEQEMVDKGELNWLATEATPFVCSASVPDEYLKWFDDASADRNPKGEDAQQASSQRDESAARKAGDAQ